jgi:predicted Zn finger-like uncharacterized protein
MPEIISCPDCGRKLRVPDDLIGKKVKCPSCNVMFTAAAAGNEPPRPSGSRRAAHPDDEPQRPSGSRRAAQSEGIEDQPRASRRAEPREEEVEVRVRRRDDDDDYEYYEDEERAPISPRQAWKKVRSGLNFIVISIYVLLGAIGVGILGFCGLWVFLMAGAASTAPSGPGGPAGFLAGGFAGAAILMGFLWLLGFASTCLRITGHVFCLSVPSKRGSGLKGLAIATLATSIAHIVLSLLDTFASIVSVGMAGFSPFGVGSMTGLHMMLILAAGVCSLAWFVVFLLFLRGVAKAVKQSSLAGSIVSYMISVGVYIGVFILFAGIVIAVAGLGALSMASSGSARAGASAGMAIVIMVLAFECFALLAGLALFIWYIVILHQVRGAVDEYLRR